MHRPAAALLAAALALTMTACQQPNAHGRVVHKWIVAKPLILTLVIKQPDGSKVKIHVHGHAWRHCHIGDQYPQCDR